MAIPKTLESVKPQDFTFRPIKVNKEFEISSSLLETTESGYVLLEGIYTEKATQVGSTFADEDPKNDIDGSFKSIIWKHIDVMYYRYPYESGKTHEHSNRRYTFKHLTESASLVHVPYLDYGEMIKPKSVEIYNADLDVTVVDDGYGNLYVPDVESVLPYLPRHNTIGYWGFNSLFRVEDDPTRIVDHIDYSYDSYIFASHQNNTKIQNVKVVDGLDIDGSPTGRALSFIDKDDTEDENPLVSYARTRDNQYLNFDSEEEFTISFWVKPDSSTTNGKIISKNGVTFTNQFGRLPKTKESGMVVEERHVSSSYVDINTDVYPYDFEWNGGTLTVRRSDGIRTVTLTCSVSSGTWSHVSLIRYTDGGIKKLALYCNGTESDTQTDTTKNPINTYALMFGARNQRGDNQYVGLLDEVRFLDKAFYDDNGDLDTTFYSNISNSDYAYNTAIVGNVFYRKGCIVISPLNNYYKDLLTGDFTITYKGTHVIYQYEVLCRVRKGDFNLSMNPSARKSPKSDLLIDDFVNVDEDEALRPYASSIGFYNTQGDLVAVGKLGQALQMRDDVDINILVKWDV